MEMTMATKLEEIRLAALDRALKHHESQGRSSPEDIIKTAGKFAEWLRRLDPGRVAQNPDGESGEDSDSS